MSKKIEDHTANALKALQRKERIPAAVFLPPTLRNGKNVIYAYVDTETTVEDDILRIKQEADPVGLMIALATGQPVATHYVERDDETKELIVRTEYETLPITSPLRERIIKDLTQKVLPRMSVRKRDQPDDERDEDDPAWEAAVANAAERAEED